MSTELQFSIGRHDEAIENLKAEVAAMRADLAEIKAMVARAQGGLRTLVAVGSIGGAIGAGFMKIIAMMKGGS